MNDDGSACRTWRVYKLTYALACMMSNAPRFCDVWAWKQGTAPTPPVA